MDFGALLSRTWKLIWEHKFLIVLGVLVALGSGGGGGGGGSNLRTVFDSSGSGDWEFDPDQWGPDWPKEFDDWDLERMWSDVFAAPLIIALVLVMAAIGLLIGTLVWIVSTLAKGGLIHAAGVIDGGSESSLGQAFAAAWQRKWPLLGVNLIPAIPGLLMLLIALLMVGGIVISAAGDRNLDVVAPGLIVVGVSLICLLVPLALILQALAVFANRACMLEERGVRDSYRRGWQVLKDALGQALVLYLIQIGISIAAGLLLVVPSIAMALCCLLWPLLLLISGIFSTYFESLWTLAWREWTASGPQPQPQLEPEAAPR